MNYKRKKIKIKARGYASSGQVVIQLLFPTVFFLPGIPLRVDGHSAREETASVGVVATGGSGGARGCSHLVGSSGCGGWAGVWFRVW